MEAYKLPLKEIFSALSSSQTKGLTNQHAKQLQNKFGYNILKEKKKITALGIFINQFKSFIIYILLFATILSLSQKEYVDAIVIFIVIIVNSIIGFIQEYKAEKAIESLKKLSGLECIVLRDGKKQTIKTSNLVPGDIVYVEEGNKIPADARLIEEFNLQINESSLTGESVPVSKEVKTITSDISLSQQTNMIFAGTTVVKGRGTAIITSIGMKTQIGQIASMLNEVEDKLTPLQKKLDVLGRKIGIAIINITVIVLITGLFTQGLFTYLFQGDFLAFFAGANYWLLLAVALAVAAVPSGLPAIVTIALSQGVKKMIKHDVLIRRLPSVETLGETTIICSDKTGTLTQNKMTVKKIFTNMEEYDLCGEELKGYLEHKGKKKIIDNLLFKIGVLCNNASIEIKNKKVTLLGDPTESSLLVSARKVGLNENTVKKQVKIINENPFDSLRKMMSIIIQEGKSKILYAKGAPEVILKSCSHILINGKVQKLTTTHKKNIVSANVSFAQDALRVLGFAYKKVSKTNESEDKLIFVGLQAMIDPPRKDVAQSIQRCKEASIDVIMITGDNLITAQAIASQIGIKGEAMTGDDFAQLSKKKQMKSLESLRIFARVAPAHKMLIVGLLQEMGHIVAMTGDGVNDAPAIKKADIGIGMGITGTDVVKEASEMILLKDNFTSIVNAIEEGRGIYINIKKFVNYLLSCNLGEVFIVFFAVILFGVEMLPLTAIMLLWLNLVTDGLPALALSMDKNPDNLMKLPPQESNAKIVNSNMMFNILYVSFLITAGVLGLFYFASDSGLAHMQTLAFSALITFELIRLSTVRTEQHVGMFSNLYLVGAVLISIGLQLLVIYTPLREYFGTVPLSIADWIAIIGVGALIYALNTLSKPLRRILHIKD